MSFYTRMPSVLDFKYYREMLGDLSDAEDIARLLKVHGLVSAGLEYSSEEELSNKCTICQRYSPYRVCGVCRDKERYFIPPKRNRDPKPEPEPKAPRTHHWSSSYWSPTLQQAQRLLKAMARIQPKAPPAAPNPEPPPPRPEIWIRIPLDQIK